MLNESKLLMNLKKLAFEQEVARLSEKQFAFSRQALERAVLAEGCISGMERADFSSLLEKSPLIRLGAAKNDDGNFYFTTEENVKMEMEIKDNLKNSFSLNPLSSPMSVLRHITTEKGLTLSTKQTEAVLHIALNSSQYLAVQGLARTGKTYMLNAVRELYEQSGYTVRGASFTGKAAEGLHEGANIKSTTLHSFLNKLEKEAGNAIDSSNEIKKSWDFMGLIPSKKAELWVIDEAGLTDNPLILHLQRAAKLKRAKVIFVGDYQQLSPVGMGNYYSNFVQSGEISTCYLSDIRRQKNQTLLEAVKASVSGDMNRSLSLMAESTNEIKSTTRRFKAISKEYTALPLDQQAKTIVLTAKNKDRVAINALIREDLIKSGALSTEQAQEFKIQNNGKKEEISRTFALNEKIIFLRNHHQLGIMNEQTGTIESIYGSRIKVKSNGKSVMIDSNDYKNFDYGYCVTSHKAQGITVDKAMINIDSTQRILNNRNAFYVNISRARSAVTIYTDNKAKLNEQVGTWVKKLTFDDFLIQNVTKDFPKVKIEKQALSRFSLPNFQNNLVGKALHTCNKTAELGVKLALRALTRVTKASSDEIHTNSHHRGMRM